MTEITRVPLQPVAKGAVAKIWIGVAALALAAGGVAYAALPAGVHVETLTEGSGPTAKADDVVFVRYTGKLKDGTVFDKSTDTKLPIPGIFPEGQPMPLSRVVPGFREGAMKMQKGGKYVLEIPSEKAYGATPPEGAPIPPNSDLTFDVEVTGIMTEADFQQRVSMFQQLMQMQQGKAGAPGEAPVGEAPAQP